MSGSAPISFIFQVSGDSEAKSKIQSVGGAFQNFGKQAETTSMQTQKVTRDFKGAALGMSAAASSAVALGFQYDNLRKSEIRVEQAEKNLTVAKGRLSEAQQALTKLQIQGISTGDDYEQAVLRLDAAQQQHAIATEKVSLATGDLSQDQLGFALNVIPTVITSVASVAAAASAMGITLSASAIATNVAALGMRAFSVAIRLAQLAMGPIGLILIGIGTVLTLIATNAFGVRDAINAMGKAIGDAIPFLKPVMEFFGAVGNALFGETDVNVSNAPPAAEGPVPDWAQAGADYGAATTSSIASSGSAHVGGGNVTVKVYVDGKEIASRIKLSTTKKG